MRPLISRADRDIIGAILRIGIGATLLVAGAVIRTVIEPVTRTVRVVQTLGEPPEIH